MTNEEALGIADEAVRRANHDVRSIPKPLRVVRLIGQIDFEITVGGVLQWLVNSSGRYAADTIEAFEEIGAHECARIVQGMLAFFPDKVPPQDDTTRAMQVEQLRPEAEAAWRELGDQLLEWPDDVDALLQKYVRNNEAEFRAAATD